nr:hypothetical protein [Flavobacteriales bacterium]
GGGGGSHWVVEYGMEGTNVSNFSGKGSEDNDRYRSGLVRWENIRGPPLFADRNDGKNTGHSLIAQLNP